MEICVTLPLEQMHIQVSLKPSLVMPGWPPNVFPSPLQAGTRGTLPVMFYSNKQLPVEWLYWAKAGAGLVPPALNPLGRGAARRPKPRSLIRMSLHPCTHVFSFSFHVVLKLSFYMNNINYALSLIRDTCNAICE